MPTPRLQVHEISRSFDGRNVVDGVSLQVYPGQVTCLLGPSGCGKSTILRMIAGVDRPDSGSVSVEGKIVCDAQTDLPPERRSIGMMFQDFALFPHLTVAQNVAFGLEKSANRAERVASLLAQVGMGAFADHYPHNLSGGEQQRVALARALAPNPAILLMDEPFSGLDNRLRDEIRDETLAVLKEAGTAVVLVTHEPDEAMRMADEIALMRDGKIVQSGAPYNIYNTPVDRKAAAFFSDINVIRGTVTDLQVDTPFGQFLTPAQPNGTDVEIVIRPQHLKIELDRAGVGPSPTPQNGVAARALVERARFMGGESLIEFRTEAEDIALSATVPGVFLPKPKTPMWLMIRRDRCFVYPLHK